MTPTNDNTERQRDDLLTVIRDIFSPVYIIMLLSATVLVLTASLIDATDTFNIETIEESLPSFLLTTGSASIMRDIGLAFYIALFAGILIERRHRKQWAAEMEGGGMSNQLDLFDN